MMSGIVLSFFLLTVFSLARSHIEDDFANQNRLRSQNLKADEIPEAVEQHDEDFSRRWKAQFDKHLEEFDRYFKHLGDQNRIHPEALKIAGQVDDVLKVPLDGAEGQVSLTMAFSVGKLSILCCCQK